MNRRQFLTIASATLSGCAMQPSPRRAEGSRLAVTMDDFTALDTVSLPASERNARILDTLARYGAQALALVVGESAVTADGAAILGAWAKAGHVIGNHTYSHLDYHRPETTLKDFAADFVRGHDALSMRPGFQRFFRFPMLREGDTVEKRDGMRAQLADLSYRNAHVTIDNSDYLIDRELRTRLTANSRTDTRPYRDMYVRHMRAFARYYRESAGEVFGRDIPHTLLTHFNLLSALYLADLLDALRSDGWTIISASLAYADEVFQRQPKVIPAGDSLVVASAREGRKKKKMVQSPVETERWLEAEFARLRP